MKFFKKNINMQQSDATQSRRFTLGQYITAVVALLMSVVAISYAARLLDLIPFLPHTAISSADVNKNFETIDTQLQTLNTIKLGGTIATTSGGTIDFPLIPAGVKRIKLALMGVTLSGTGNVLLQIGPSNGVETAGYTYSSYEVPTGTSFVLTRILFSETTAHNWYGTVEINLTDAATNTWAISVLTQTEFYGSIGPIFEIGSGYKSLTGVLNKLRLSTSGINTFKLGAVSITWEF